MPANAEKMFSASWVFPGKALLGRIRSREPHLRQRARRTSSSPNPAGVCSPRLTQLRVSARSRLPHLPHRQLPSGKLSLPASAP